MRLGATKASATSSYNGLGNQLYDLGGARPSLDLDFAGNKTLRDNISTKNLIDFTRQSSGTYVGSDGLIKTATTNLLLQSEDFSTTWSRVNVLAFGSGSIVNNAVAPDGSTTADKITPDTSNNQHRIDQTPSSTAGAQVFTVYVKAAGYSFVGLRIGFNGAGFNLSTGAIASLVTATSASITPVGNGWYRCSVYESSAAANAVTRINVTTENQSLSAVFEGDGTSGIYIWGAQLEQSSTVGEYVKTTSTINSAPRFDHNPTTGESLGLLVEESRTNLIATSEALVNVTGATTTSNTTTAPDGLATADTLTEDTSTGAHSVNTASIAWVGNTIYTFTVFLKANTRNQVNLAFGTSSNWVNGQRSAVFDLSSGTVASTAGSPVVASIESFPGSWYRCRLTATTVASPVPSTTQIQMYVAGSSSYTGNGASGLFFWGAQLEAGAFPTSYIPTTTAAVTRSADVASITGTNFSSWYRQDEGTVFADVASIYNGGRIVMFDDTVPNDRWDVRFSTTVSISSWKAGVQDVSASAGTLSNPAINLKVAAANQSNNAAIASNYAGGSFGIDTGGSSMTSGLTTMRIGSYLGSATFANGTIRRLTYWPSRLPNSTLQTITQ